MPDAQTAATALGASQPPPAVVMGATYGPGMVRQTVADIDAAQREKEAKQAPIYATMQADVAKDKAREEKLEADYKPVEIAKPPPVPENDPLKGFASAAALFAGLASALTHTPAINAMNGMAAAINGTKTGDWQQYEAGYKQWKENTDLAIEKHKLQAADMQAALEKMQTDLTTGVALAKAVAASSDDRIATKLLEEGQYEKLGDYMRASATAASEMQRNALLIQEAMPKAIASQRLTAALKSGDPAQINAAATMMQQITDPAAFTAESNEKQARAIAADPANYKDGKLTDEAFQKMMTFDPKLAMDVRKSGIEKAYAPKTYRLPDKSEVTAIVSPDGTAREVGTNRLVNLAGAVIVGAEPADKPQTTAWAVKTDPANNTQFRTRTGPDGKPEYQNMAGETIAPPTGEANLAALSPAAIKQQRVDVIGKEAIAKEEQVRQSLGQPPMSDGEKARLMVNAAASAGEIELTPQQREANAAQVATGEPLIQVIPGFGQAGIKERSQARFDAIAMIQKENPQMSPADAGRELARRGSLYIAQRSSALQIDKMLGATQQAVSQLNFNIKKTKEEMAKLPSTDLSPILNAIARGEERWTGEPAYSSLFYYMNATAMESARILQSGQASIAQLHQGAAEEAKRWASENMTPASFDAVSKAMIDEGDQRIRTYSDALRLQTTMPGETPPRLGAQATPQTSATLNIPQEAVGMLRNDPTSANMLHFDEVFGAGSAAKVLGQ